MISDIYISNSYICDVNLSLRSKPITKEPLHRKWHSDSDATCGRKLSSFESATDAHRPRTHTAGHVHFSEQEHAARANALAGRRPLALRQDKSTSRDDVFQGKESCQQFALASPMPDHCSCCCCFSIDTGRSNSNRFPQLARSSPVLMQSMSMRAKIKALKAREIRAIRTLGTIVGAFILCWLPFFVVTLANPFCNCHMPPILLDVVLWLGYCSSMVNPMLYAAFNREFHAAFRKLLLGKTPFFCRNS